MGDRFYREWLGASGSPHDRDIEHKAALHGALEREERHRREMRLAHGGLPSNDDLLRNSATLERPVSGLSSAGMTPADEKVTRVAANTWVDGGMGTNDEKAADEAVESYDRRFDGFIAGQKDARRYTALRKVLDDAIAQASSGKGHERHDNGRAFEEQTICWVNRELGSADFARGQACKKTLESARLGPEAAEKELLGAINYLAAAIIQIREAKK